VLEWVYGSIVSTAEKARDGAKRQLGLRPPTAAAAFDSLMRCLEDQAAWEARAKGSKELLNAMLQSRKEADELSKQYDLRPVPTTTTPPPAPAAPAAVAASSSSSGAAVAADGGEGGAAASAAADGSGDAAAAAAAASAAAQLPDAVIIKMLRREALLTSAKLHALMSDHLECQRTLSRLKAQIRHVSQRWEGVASVLACDLACVCVCVWAACSAAAAAGLAAPPLHLAHPGMPAAPSSLTHRVSLSWSVSSVSWRS
jgi:hypothetical protein